MKDKMHEKLNELTRLQTEMNTAVLHQVEKAFECMFSFKDDEEIMAIIYNDEIIDNLEVKIDDLCFSILALQQPLAVDLRYVLTVQKIITDMERMGDEAVSFSKRALYLHSRPPVSLSGNFLKMTQHVLRMCKKAAQAFTNRDVAMARSVIQDESMVNGYFDQLHNEFIDFMLEDKKNVQSGDHLIRAARCVERIADHACNVSEDVIYMVEARNVKHVSPDEV